MDLEIQKNLRFNYFVNIMDGGFFGFALGFASFSTILPLFIASMTDSALLVGLVMAVHSLCSQIPQLLISNYVSKQGRFKPLVTFLTIQERIPFVGLALIAFLIPRIGVTSALVLSLIMIAWQGIGAGVTGPPWQLMINKIILPEFLATFFGLQGALSNLLASGGAIVAGILLDRVSYPNNYAVTFLIACIFMIVSWVFLNLTREPAHAVAVNPDYQPIWSRTISILKRDPNFAWLLVSRLLSQFGIMAFTFYAVYMVKVLGASETQAGIQTSVLMMASMVMNIFLGWLADHWSRLRVLEIGFVAMFLSALIACLAPNLNWFYLVMALAGTANTALWTIMMALTLQFGNDEDRPTYVGMANTLIAPVTIIAPLIGGWLANVSGYQAAFLSSALVSIVSILILHFFVKDPKQLKIKQAQIDEVSDGL
jgi:MFS family permease